MSYYESLDVVSMVVGATIARYDVVHINGGTRLIKPVTDVDAEGICGIAQEGGVIGDTIAMAIAGVSKVVCGDEVTRGAQIGSNTTDWNRISKWSRERRHSGDRVCRREKSSRCRSLIVLRR